MKHISVLYNLILKQEYLPMPFRHGIIIPLYKGNNKDKTNPNSYRAVTLTSSLGKLLEKIILNRIQKLLLEINNVIPHSLQFGFVKEHGAIPAIYTLKEAIHYYLEHNSIVYAIFLDNEKAFDRVWQDGLLYKLNQTGIQGKLWNLIYISYKTATAHVQYNGLTSQVFRIEQGVGQGRVLSAWLFSLFINDLIYELLSTKSGLLVGPISIPAILLADDTTLLSSSVNGIQTLLNVVNSYAIKWRLKYNALKSSVLIFTPSKKYQNFDDSNICLKLGNTELQRKSKTTYAGTLIDSEGKSFERTDNASKKLKQKLHSLYTVGVNPRGMSALTNNLIWKRIILTTALFACETWEQLPCREKEILEISQRYFVRFILSMDKRSPSDSCISNVGLWTVEGYIDKMKLLFFGRLCRSKSTTVHKQLFNFRLGQILAGESSQISLTYEFMKILTKYDLNVFIENFLVENFIPDKLLWRKIVKQSVEIYEENKWKKSVERRRELNRYAKIQTCLTEHRLLRLAVIYPTLNVELMTLVKLGSMAIKTGQCSLCNSYTTDLLKHYILSCTDLLEIRTEMFYKIVDMLTVEDSVCFFDQDDDEFVESLLGSMNHAIQTLDSDVWNCLMCHTADYMFKLYQVFKYDLYSHIYDLN